MTDSLLSLKIKVVNAGILARTKENKAWDFYRLQVDKNPKELEMQLLKERIESLEKEIQVEHDNFEKRRNKMIDIYFEKWRKLSAKLEKKYGVKINGKLEDLLKTKQELKKKEK